MTSAQPNSAEQSDRVAQLERRVAELEAQLLETEAWANHAVGAAQERYYWLDRWHVDLNAVMARPAAARVRAALRALRSVVRGGRRLKRRVTTSK